MIDIKSISQDQRKYKNRTPNDLNIKLIAIMVNFLFQYSDEHFLLLTLFRGTLPPTENCQNGVLVLL